MSAIRYVYTVIFLILLSVFNPAQAETSLKPFGVGSYQQLVAAHANQPFMLVIWSLTCPSCVKDMALLNKLHQDKPTLKIVMLATDDISEAAQVQNMLTKNNLQSVENWIYAEENTQKLNYEIDPNWFGELPRTYFFDAKHQRTGVSGVIKETEYLQMFEKILKP